MRIRTGIFGASAIGLFVAIVQGCATEATVIDETEDSGTVEPVVDSGKKDSATPAKDSSTPDSAKPDAAKPDATPVDSSVDAADSGLGPKPGDPFDPLAPKTGDACPPGVNLNDTVDRRCGLCGTQKALCETGKVVGAYGACTGEKTGAGVCLPGERKITSCGFCGTQVQNCDNTCAYITGLCQNEVANGCTANEVTYIEGICATATDVRKQTCSAACAKGAPEPCAPRPIDEITVSQTAGQTVTGNFQTTGTIKAPLLSGSCPATESATVSSFYHWVRVKNAGADEVTVSLANGIPAGSSTRPAVTLTGYAGSTIPADRKACTLSPVTSSPERITFAIPAGGSVMVLTQLDSASAAQSKLALEVKTNFVGPETPEAPQYMLDMSQTNATAVTQSIAFNAANLLTRPSLPVTDPDPCPLTLSSTGTNYSYIRVNNTGNAARTATIETTGGTDVILAVYNGQAPLSSGRTACTGQWADETGPAFGDALLTGVSIPAMGYVTVYVAKFSSTTGGTATLKVTTSN